MPVADEMLAGGRHIAFYTMFWYNIRVCHNDDGRT